MALKYSQLAPTAQVRFSNVDRIFAHHSDCVSRLGMKWQALDSGVTWLMDFCEDDKLWTWL